MPSYNNDLFNIEPYFDDYSEDNPSAIVLSVIQSGSTISVQYTSTAAGTFKYSLEHLGI